MSFAIEKVDSFYADYFQTVGYYVDRGGDELGCHFEEAVDLALQRISKRPDIGHICHFRHPSLRGLRSFQVNAPFNAVLIFYRFQGNVLQALRLMHGARDLPRRLRQSPGA